MHMIEENSPSNIVIAFVNYKLILKRKYIKLIYMQDIQDVKVLHSYPLRRVSKHGHLHLQNRYIDLG